MIIRKLEGLRTRNKEEIKNTDNVINKYLNCRQ